MFGRKSLLSLVIIALLAGFPSGISAKEREPELLMPLGPWQLDMGEHRCRLARLFGSDEDKTIFMLDQWGPSSSAQWAVAGPQVRDIKKTGRATFEFGPGGDGEEFRYTGATLDNYGAVIGGKTTVAAAPDVVEGTEERDWITDPREIPALDAEAADSIDRLAIDQRGSASFALRLGSLQKPIRALNLCIENLVESWGFDVEEQRAVAIPPKITNLDVVANRIMREYPAEALRKGAQADFHLRVNVGDDGRIEDCTLLNQTLAKDFDMKRHPCTVFQSHAKIEPALTISGNPVRSFYTTRSVYRMNGNAP